MLSSSQSKQSAALPDRPSGYRRRTRGQPRAGADALGTGAVLVEQAAKGIAPRTFNARIETVTTKPFFREPFGHRRCLMPVSGYYEWQDTPKREAALVLHGSRWFPGTDGRRSLGPVEK